MSTLTEISDGQIEGSNEDTHLANLTELRINLNAEDALFDEAVERGGCRAIFESLTEEEKKGLVDDNMLLRHFRAEKGNLNLAIEKIENTIAWRKEFRVETIKTCFEENGDGEVRKIIEKENETGKAYARGYDKSGRAVVYLNPGMENTKEEVDQMRHLVYQIERAVACTARMSGKEKVNIIINFDGFKLRNAPPLSTTRHTLDILQNHYCERLHRSYICNPPFMFRTFWAIIKPFIDPVTKEKIVFCHGEAGRKILAESFELDEMEKCASGITKMRKFNSKEYLFSPFDTTFDDVELK